MTQKQKTTDINEFLDNTFYKDDPTIKEEIEAEVENCRIAQQVYDLRTGAGLTQKQLADLVGTTQSVISRLEDADYEGHSMAMLRRVAKAVNKRMEVRFLPIKPKKSKAQAQSQSQAL